MDPNPFDDANPFAPAPPAASTAAPTFKPSDVFGDSYKEIASQPVAPLQDVNFEAASAPPAPQASSPAPAADAAVPPKSPKAEPRLEFHNFEASPSAPAPPPPPQAPKQPESASAILTSEPATAEVNFETQSAALTAEEPKKKEEAPTGWHNAWRPSFYKPYFDVDVGDVLARMLAGGLWPFGRNFFDFIKPKADLYGPFWISTTLLFLLAAISNLSSYIAYWNAGQDGSWNYDFEAVVVGVGVIYGYVGGAPILLWIVSHFWLDLEVTIAEWWCLYGYSMTIYLAVSFICIVPIDWLRWLLVGVGCFVSTLTLVWSLWKPLVVKGTNRFVGIITTVVAGLLHFGLALVYKLYFFGKINVPSATSD